MRLSAFKIIKTAAVAAGLSESAVMHVSDKDLATLPKQRVEISYLPEQYRRTGKPIRKFSSPGKEESHRTLRREIHEIRLPLRVAIKADNEAWLTSFSILFLAALPSHTNDDAGNLIQVRVDKAEYGGFTRRMVEVFKKRSKTYHVTFTGMSTRDTEIPLIREVTITPNYREEPNGQD